MLLRGKQVWNLCGNKVVVDLKEHHQAGHFVSLFKGLSVQLADHISHTGRLSVPLSDKVGCPSLNHLNLVGEGVSVGVPNR